MKELPANRIICGSAKEVLPTMPAESINCCISSPPYWALRDYGVVGQLGLEKTFEEYIDKLCTIYDEVKRVLCKDGTCWVNLGDTYNSGGNYRVDGAEGDKNNPFLQKGGNSPDCGRVKVDTKLQGLPTKSLCLIPQRFAIEMVNRGWILRNVIIWHKPNPMPSSAKDRFTVDYELVFFMVKQQRYFFEPIYEPFLTESNAERPRMGQGNQTKYNQKRQGQTWAERKAAGEPMRHGLNGAAACSSGNYESPLGRNARTVWTIPTQAFSEAHFSTFPEKLVEPMILSGCPKEVCTKCGKSRRKVYETSGGTIGKGWTDHKKDIEAGMSQKMPELNAVGHTYKRGFKGYTDCGCKESFGRRAKFKPGVVLDPFGGAMTTALVAYKNKRDYVMIELKKSYCEMGQKRLDKEKEKYGLLESTIDK